MQSLIFFGSDQYSAVALKELINSPLRSTIYDILSIVTDRPKPVGKGLVMTPSPVEILAKTHDLKVSYYPTNPDEMSNFVSLLESSFKNLESGQSPIGLCASFDHLIPANIIELFAGNLYNLHPSLLPQYRNVSPVQYAIALGDKVTGITLFRISTGIDNGEIIAQTDEPILEDDTTPTLTPRLFKIGAELFLRSDLVGCKPDQKPTRSDLVGVPLIFTKRLTRNSGFIEWPALLKLLTDKSITSQDTKNELLLLRLGRTHGSAPTAILSNLLRALTPWPGVWSLVPTRKGELRIALATKGSDATGIQILISGKSSPISLSDFEKYYL